VSTKGIKVRYQDEYSVLVIAPTGRMRQLFVPFQVECICSVGPLPQGVKVYVDAVISNPEYRLLYWINQRLYPYHYFTIHIRW
jgi:hypothetical protein